MDDILKELRESLEELEKCDRKLCEIRKKLERLVREQKRAEETAH